MNDHQEEMARALFEEAGDAMFLCDPDTDQILDVNPMAERLSGFCRAELLGMTITALLRFEDKGGEQRLHRAASQTGVFHSQEGFFLRTRQDNVWIPVNLTVTRLHVHPKTLALMTARDIREQHEASTQLRKMETELRRVLASVPDCLWSADIDAQGRWTFRFFSPVVQKITGRPADFFLGGLAHWRDLIHPEDRPRWKQALVGLRAGQSTQIEYRLVRPDGGVRWVRDSVAVSRGEEERTLRLDGVLTDISDRKEAEEALRSTEEELRIAHRIQKKLFPSRPPVIPGFDIGGASYAAAATGGDYFDYLPLADGSWGFVISDVSGHGFGPALLASATRAYLRVLAQTQTDVGTILTRANRALEEDTEEGRFITLLLARLEAPIRSLVYTSAGHSTGYILDAQGAVKTLLRSTGLPLGVSADSIYQTSTPLPLEPGDLVFLHTDGVIEAFSPNDKPYGVERALEVVRAHQHQKAQDIVEGLYEAVRGFTQNTTQLDDITAIVIKAEATV